MDTASGTETDESDDGHPESRITPPASKEASEFDLVCRLYDALVDHEHSREPWGIEGAPGLPVPDEFFCPISLMAMRSPCVASRPTASRTTGMRSNGIFGIDRGTTCPHRR